MKWVDEIWQSVNGKAKGESLSNVFTAKVFIFALVTIPLGPGDLTRVGTSIFFSLDCDILSYRQYSRPFYYVLLCTDYVGHGKWKMSFSRHL